MIGPSKDIRPAVKPSVAKKEEATPSLLAKKLEREKESLIVDQKSTSNSENTTKLPPVPQPLLDKPATPTEEKRQESEKKLQASAKTEKSAEYSETVNPKSGIAPRNRSETSHHHRSNEKKAPSVDLSLLPPEVQEKQRQELVEQLKIQLSAYNDYLREQLQLQQDELQRIHLVALEEKVLEEKMKYQRELASSIVRLQEVENVLKSESQH